VFDIGFFELLVVAVVALVVIGPERLPETVRGISLWIGRLKRSLRETRTELERQLGADEIRRQLHNEEVMQSLERTRREVEASMNQVLSEGAKDDPDAEERNKPRNYAPEEPLPDHAHGDANVASHQDHPKP
jgi:sec-independent protein translocase protein TatB